MRKFTSLMVAGAVCAGIQVADAASVPATLSEFAKSPSTTRYYEELTKDTSVPNWVSQGTETPVQQVSYQHQPAYTYSTCKPHDCSSHSFAMLYVPFNHETYGVLRTTEESAESSSEKLHWFGMKGGAETTSGKALLYSALVDPR